MTLKVLAAREGTVAVEYALLTSTLAVAVVATGFILGTAISGKLARPGDRPAAFGARVAQPVGSRLDFVPARPRMEIGVEPPLAAPDPAKPPRRALARAPASRDGAVEATAGWTSWSAGPARDE